MNDKNTVRKLYRSIALAWAIAMVWALALQKPWIALSITVGVALGTVVLASFEYIVRSVLVPGAQGVKYTLVKLALVKYPLLAVVIYLLIRSQRINMLAVCGGIVLTHIAMGAKLLGIRMVEGRNDQSRTDGRPEAGHAR